MRIGAFVLLILSPLVVASPPTSWTTEQKRADLLELRRLIDTYHPTPYDLVEADDWDRIVEEELAALDDANDAEFLFALQRLMTLIGDGHSRVIQPAAFRELVRSSSWPVRFGLFDDGLFVVSATDEHASMLGGRVTALGGVPVEEVFGRLERVSPADNAWAARQWSVAWLHAPIFTETLGLHASDEPLMLVADVHGQTVVAALEATDASPSDGPPAPGWRSVREGQPPPRWLARRQEPFWYELLPEHNAIYVQVNAVRNGPGGTQARFWEGVFDVVRSEEIDRMILDYRHNGGGNNYLNQPLIHGLIQADRLRAPGRLFVLTSPQTFSAAANCVAKIDRETNAVFIGEPTGAGPNHAGDADTLVLPNTGVSVRISRLWWQISDPRDTRRAMLPDVPMALTYDDFVAGRDRALEAALAFDADDAAAFEENPPNTHWRRPSQEDAPRRIRRGR